MIKFTKFCIAAVILISLLVFLAGCQSEASPESTPGTDDEAASSSTPAPTPKPTPAPTVTPAETSTPEKEPAPKPAPEPTVKEAPLTKYTLSTTISPKSGGTIEPTGGTYDDGAQVTLAATPTQGYAFDGWSGDATGTSSPITVTMNSNKSITANFKACLVDGMIFRDNFDDNSNKWGGTVENGRLLIGETAKEGYNTISAKYKWPPAAPDYPDFGYEVEIIPIEADDSWGKGIVFLCGKDLSYVFLISGNGHYKLTERNDESRDIISWTASDYLNQGNTSNTLKVICRDSIIELYANGYLLESVSGEFPDDIEGNGIGLIVTASGGSTVIAFDNIKMWPVTPSSSDEPPGDTEGTGIGEIITGDIWQVRINSVVRTKTVENESLGINDGQAWPAKAGHSFVVVEVQIGNISAQEQEYHSSGVTLIDNESHSYLPVGIGDKYLGYSIDVTWSGKSPPGPREFSEIRYDNIVFEVPDGTGGFSFKFLDLPAIYLGQ
jgi:uncharacterized repeat protein (TIGR02543 family)